MIGSKRTDDQARKVTAHQLTEVSEAGEEKLLSIRRAQTHALDQ